jgi:hypothetical protein
MGNVGRPKVLVELTEEERRTLMRWSRRAKSSQTLATRSRILLASADGLTNVVAAAQCGRLLSCLIEVEPSSLGLSRAGQVS